MASGKWQLFLSVLFITLSIRYVREYLKGIDELTLLILFAGGRRRVLPDAARELSLHLPPLWGDMAPRRHGCRQSGQVQENLTFLV